MYEASKTKAILSPEEQQWLSGRGIDIGCGPDPITPNCVRFDQEQGDANHITDYIHEQFDFVFSSHCLEHMTDPRSAIREWWELVKPGGYMITVIPDEDLYEQGVFPSRFNFDHKHTFTISKRKSWSPVSINVLDLEKSLFAAKPVKIELQDLGFDRSGLTFSGPLEYQVRHNKIYRFANFLDRHGVSWLKKRLIYPKTAIDQTYTSDAMAQILWVVQKDPQVIDAMKKKRCEGGASDLFVFYSGLGDGLLLTAVAENYYRETGKKMMLSHPNPELFEQNPHVDFIPNLAPYRLPESGSKTLHDIGIQLKFLSYADYKQERNGLYSICLPKEGNLIAKICSQAGLSGEMQLAPRLYLTEEEKGFGKLSQREQIVVLSGGKFKHKMWDPDKLQRLVHALKDRFDCILIGMSEDPALEGVLDMRGKLTIRQMASVLYHSRLYIGPIGGVLHLARAVDCPAVVLQSAMEDRSFFYPEYTFISDPNGCSRCKDEQKHYTSCSSDQTCTASIPYEPVLSAVEQELSHPRVCPQIHTEMVTANPVAGLEFYPPNLRHAIRAVVFVVAAHGGTNRVILRDITVAEGMKYSLRFDIPVDFSPGGALFLSLPVFQCGYCLDSLSLHSPDGRRVWDSDGNPDSFSSFNAVCDSSEGKHRFFAREKEVAVSLALPGIHVDLAKGFLQLEMTIISEK